MVTPIVSFWSARFVVALVTAIVVVVAVPLLIVAIHGNAVGSPAAASVHQSAGSQLDATTKGRSAGDDSAKPKTSDESDDGE